MVKLLPPLVLEEEDRAWICSGFDAFLADRASPTGAVCYLLRNLATHAAKAKMVTIAR